MLTERPATPEDTIEHLLSDPALRSLVAAHRILEPQPPMHAPWPEGIDPRIVTALRGRGVEALYTHQAHAISAVRARHNVCVVTPTASGKTLCYNLPVLDAVANDVAARALYIFPTKALAADQLVELRALADAADIGLKTHTYDGDTPANVRSVVRSAGQVVITNPDMLHSGDPPPPHQVVTLFENLQLRRHRRAAHLPRAVRLPRGQRRPPAAPHLPPSTARIPSSSAPPPPSPTRASTRSGCSGGRSSSSTRTARPRGAQARLLRQSARRQRAARHPRSDAARSARRIAARLGARAACRPSSSGSRATASR